MYWRLSHRADEVARDIADRHYSRQKPGTPQFVPPGRCLVLVAEGAYWVTSWPFAQYVKHAWPGAWMCSAFRRESGPLASELIREAVAATVAEFGKPPALGMVTFIDPRKTKHKRDPGRCFRKAGFKYVKDKDGRCILTKGGLVVMRLPAWRMPAAERPLPFLGRLFTAAMETSELREMIDHTTQRPRSKRRARAGTQCSYPESRAIEEKMIGKEGDSMTIDQIIAEVTEEACQPKYVLMCHVSPSNLKALLAEITSQREANLSLRLLADAADAWWLDGDPDNSYGCPAEFAEETGLPVGAEFQLQAAAYWPETYRVTKVADDTSDDVECEQIGKKRAGEFPTYMQMKADKEAAESTLVSQRAALKAAGEALIGLTPFVAEHGMSGETAFERAWIKAEMALALPAIQAAMKEGK